MIKDRTFFDSVKYLTGRDVIFNLLEDGQIKATYDYQNFHLPERLGVVPDDLTFTQGYELFSRKILNFIKNKKFGERIANPVNRESIFDEELVFSLLERENPIKADTRNVLNNLHQYKADEERLLIVDSNNTITDVISLDSKDFVLSEYLSGSKFVILKQGLRKNTLAKWIELLITGKNNDILSTFYSNKQKPKEIMLDQVPYYYKVLPSINRLEYEYVSSLVHNPAIISAEKVYYSKDINSRLFGYGNSCPICGFETDFVNPFFLKDVVYKEQGVQYKLRLYLCANDFYAVDSWIINNVNIGGQKMSDWITEIKNRLHNNEDSIILPKMLKCSIRYVNKISYNVFNLEEQKGIPDSEISIEESKIGDEMICDYTLSPLLAVKWYKDNEKKELQ
ncbi:hypothetical protein D3C75_738210 [compost metagenome]